MIRSTLLPFLPLLTLGALGVSTAGCKTGTEGVTVYKPLGEKGTSSANAAGTPPANAPAASATPTPGARSPGAPTSGTGGMLSLDAVPQNLRTDAYEYYGLGRKLPITMTLDAGGQTKTGAQDVRLREVKSDEARFEIISTDGLEIFGLRNLVSLRPDGIRIVESDVAKSGENDYELPTGLVPGKTWVATQTLDNGASKMKLTLTQKVVGTMPLTTPVATYPDALRITGTGVGTLNGKPIRMETESWFVKGRGNVKNIFRSTTGGQTSSTSLVEAK